MGAFFFNQRRMGQQRERNGHHISYSLSKIHRASNPHCPSLHIGLFNISGFPTFQSGVLRLFYSSCAAHVFFIVSCSYHVTVINFSVFNFYIIVY